MGSEFKSRFEGRPFTRKTFNEAETAIYRIGSELEDARTKGDLAKSQALRQELLYAKAWLAEWRRVQEKEIHKLSEEHDAAVRELAEHERKAESRRRNPPPGKRVVSADVNPYMNRIGMLLDDEDATAVEQWDQARRQGYSDPWEKDRKRIRRSCLAVVAIVVIALAIWFLF